jgi:mono/diheme cytochrome c family protein
MSPGRITVIRSPFFSVGFGIVVLLSSCQSSASEPDPSSESQVNPVLSSVPSISELAGTPALEVPPLPALDSDEIALGQEVYADNCAECHGESLEGEAEWQQQNEDSSFRSPPHDESGHTWHHGDKVLLESIVLGGVRLPDNIGGFSNMPAFGETLTEGEIAAVLIYIKSIWPEDIHLIQWERTIQERNQ